MNPILKARVASTAAVFLVAASTAAIAAPSASAYTESNKVHNCFGRYYNTDFDQLCSGSGAGYTGTYETTGPCDFEGDEVITKYRSKGSTTTYDGTDCTFDVETGQTRFF